MLPVRPNGLLPPNVSDVQTEVGHQDVEPGCRLDICDVLFEKLLEDGHLPRVIQAQDERLGHALLLPHAVDHIIREGQGVSQRPDGLGRPCLTPGPRETGFQRVRGGGWRRGRKTRPLQRQRISQPARRADSSAPPSDPARATKGEAPALMWPPPGGPGHSEERRPPPGLRERGSGARRTDALRARRDAPGEGGGCARAYVPPPGPRHTIPPPSSHSPHPPGTVDRFSK